MNFLNCKRRKFTLLEVLIALALIALALPLLISPFVYMAAGMREDVQTARLEKAASMSISNLLVDLHLKKIPLNALESPQEYEAPFDWYKETFQEDELAATYHFASTRENGSEDNSLNGLWKVLFSLQIVGQKEPMKFEYLFGVIAAEI